MTYKKAGVDISQADAFIRGIKPLLKKTRRPGMLGGIGGFSGLFKPQLEGVEDPVLVSSTDGVGTKLLIAEELKKYDTVGIDLVAMCVNDILVTGAEPLFFLDYIAAGRLNRDKLHAVMEGIVEGCRQARCALVGGETAELPDMYEGEAFDLAGFCVGLVSRKRILDGSLCRKGDRIIGLASSGIHSNGFSLARKVFSQREIREEFGKELLTPTRIYVSTVLDLLKSIPLKAAAHITGGGFYDNVPRVLPEGLRARIQKGTWPVPPLFDEIRARGNVEEREMYRTFNMGIGMALIADAGRVEAVVSRLKKTRQKAWVIGEIDEGERSVLLI
jgi:phosphoribosylformylglycinamidine cyclo-ligase